MRPDPLKGEQDLPKHVEMWQEKAKRLRAHGDKLQLAPVFQSSTSGCSLQVSQQVPRDLGGRWGHNGRIQVLRGDVGRDAQLAFRILDNDFSPCCYSILDPQPPRIYMFHFSCTSPRHCFARRTLVRVYLHLHVDYHVSH